MLAKLLNKLLKFEHTIYCMTNCKIELFLHKSFYKYRKERYNNYLRTHHLEWFITDNIL